MLPAVITLSASAYICNMAWTTAPNLESDFGIGGIIVWQKRFKIMAHYQLLFASTSRNDEYILWQIGCITGIGAILWCRSCQFLFILIHPETSREAPLLNKTYGLPEGYSSETVVCFMFTNSLTLMADGLIGRQVGFI